MAALLGGRDLDPAAQPRRRAVDSGGMSNQIGSGVAVDHGEMQAAAVVDRQGRGGVAGFRRSYELRSIMPRAVRTPRAEAGPV